MPYQIISTDYFNPTWYKFSFSSVETKKNSSYKALGEFSQGTNWEKVFALGNKINKDLQITEQRIIDDVTNLRKRKNT